jgi:hypothetical protein
LPLLHPAFRSEVELIELVLSICAQVGEAQEAVEKEVVGGRARDPAVARRSMVDSLRCWGSSAEGIWFPLKKFKFISG